MFCFGVKTWIVVIGFCELTFMSWELVWRAVTIGGTVASGFQPANVLFRSNTVACVWDSWSQLETEERLLPNPRKVRANFQLNRSVLELSIIQYFEDSPT